MWILSKQSASQNNPTISANHATTPKKLPPRNHLLGFLVVITVKAVHQSRLTESWTLPSPTKGVQASSPAVSIHQLTFSGASSKSKFNGGKGCGSIAFLLDWFLPLPSKYCRYKIPYVNHWVWKKNAKGSNFKPCELTPELEPVFFAFLLPFLGVVPCSK